MPDTDRKKAHESWLKFLNPESLRCSLILASLYLAAYEILRTSIIDQIKSFYTIGCPADAKTADPQYTTDVVSLDKSPLRASALWLQRRGVLDASDLIKLDSIREHRNAIAHDLPKFVTTTEAHVDVSLFQAICELVAKVDRWWIVEFEIPVNSDFDGKDIDSSGCQSGNMIFLHMLVQIAIGSPEDPEFYYRKFQKLSNHDA